MFAKTKSITRGVVAAAVVAVSAMGASSASAWVADLGNADKNIAKAQKGLLKLQQDVYKQGIKNVACVVKATAKCNYKAESDLTTVESCNLATYDDAAYAGINPKFVAAVNKCESKQDFTKKLPKGMSSAQAYTDMACPGDADSDTSDVAEDFTDLESWQAGDGKRSVYNTVDALGAIVRVLTPDAKQQYKDVGTLSKYAAGLGKCIEKCEVDVKDKKGNGGTTDDGTICFPGDAGMDANFQACYNKNFEKMEKKLGAGGGTYSGILPQIDAAYGNAANNSFNKPACSGVLPSPSGAFLDGAANF